MNAGNPSAAEPTARGPRDSFFCLKYQVWYPLEDCVYRGIHKTFPGCVNCFQGHMNIRSAQRGTRPPLCEATHDFGARGGEPRGALIPIKRR